MAKRKRDDEYDQLLREALEKRNREARERTPEESLEYARQLAKEARPYIRRWLAKSKTKAAPKVKASRVDGTRDRAAPEEFEARAKRPAQSTQRKRTAAKVLD